MIFDGMTDEQMKAYAAEENVVVAAGAGSGKTRVLAARFVHHVLSGRAGVKEILALTFTNKAAAEMHDRIRQSLEEVVRDAERAIATYGPEAPSRAREALVDFADASISTIDSFCARVLKPDAQAFGLPPDFDTDEGLAKEIAEREALAFMLERRRDPAVALLVSAYGFQTAWRELLADVALRAWGPAPRSRFDPAAIAASCRDFAERTVEEDERAIDALVDTAFAAAESSSKSAKIKACPRFEAITVWRDRPVSPEAMDAIADCSHKTGPSKGEFAESCKEARERARRARSFMDWLSRFDAIEAAWKAIAECADRALEARLAAGVVGFRDVANCAIELLERRKDARAAWKRAYRSVMIDECQDNDPLQKDLAFLLCERLDREGDGIPGAEDLEPGKLFMVGDEKQSIYRFRGADVSVFREIAELLPGSIALTTNHRSTRKLAGFFDSLFGRVFLSAERAWDARFEGVRPRDRADAIESRIEYRYLYAPRASDDEDDDEESAEKLARHVAEFVRDAVESRSLKVEDKDGPRAAEYSDIAILLRQTTHQHRLERQLRRLAVPYRTQRPAGLFAESPANDLARAILAACDPTDAFSLACFLASPFARAGDEAIALATLDLAESSGDPASVLERVAERVGKDEARALRHAAGILSRLRARADTDGAATTVCRLWYDEGLRASLLAERANHPYLQHFDFVHALAVGADKQGNSVAAFAASLSERLGSREKPDEGTSAHGDRAGGAVITTIHGAKGLEFPVVVIPYVDAPLKQSGKTWFPDRGGAFTFKTRSDDETGSDKATDPFFQELDDEEKSKDLAELRRLFYVACTRAVSHLFLFGTEKKAPKEPPKKPKDSFRGLMFPVDFLPDANGDLPNVGPWDAIVRLVERSRERDVAANASPDIDEALRRYAEASTPRIRATRPSVTASALVSREDGAAPREAFPELGYDAISDRLEESAFGTICHAALAARLSTGAEAARDRREYSRLLDRLPDEVRRVVRADAERMADAFEESELGAIVRRGRAETEVPVAIELGGTVVEGRVDLLVELEDRVVVVDWKTDRARAAGEGTPYDAQLECYRIAGERLFGKPAESRLWWLRAGKGERPPRPDTGLDLLVARAARDEEAPTEATS